MKDFDENRTHMIRRVREAGWIIEVDMLFVLTWINNDWVDTSTMQKCVHYFLVGAILKRILIRHGYMDEVADVFVPTIDVQCAMGQTSSLFMGSQLFLISFTICTMFRVFGKMIERYLTRDFKLAKLLLNSMKKKQQKISHFCLLAFGKLNCCRNTSRFCFVQQIADCTNCSRTFSKILFINSFCVFYEDVELSGLSQKLGKPGTRSPIDLCKSLHGEAVTEPSIGAIFLVRTNFISFARSPLLKSRIQGWKNCFRFS